MVADGSNGPTTLATETAQSFGLPRKPNPNFPLVPATARYCVAGGMDKLSFKLASSGDPGRISHAARSSILPSRDSRIEYKPASRVPVLGVPNIVRLLTAALPPSFSI